MATNTVKIMTKSDRNLSYEQAQSLYSQSDWDNSYKYPTTPYVAPYDNKISEGIDNIKMKTATKHDAGKLDWSLLPYDSVEEIVKVLEFGKGKYAAWNWSSNGGFKYSRVFNATMRHLLAWIRGEDKDPETGLSHIAHAGCNILFLMHFIKNKDKYATNDDRQNG